MQKAPKAKTDVVRSGILSRLETYMLLANMIGDLLQSTDMTTNNIQYMNNYVYWYNICILSQSKHLIKNLW